MPLRASGLESADIVDATKNQKQVAASPRREATDFCAFPPDGNAVVGGAPPAGRGAHQYSVPP
ncbi:hypothetical protein, partial [uncultured Desulfovibrio sp.]|uniref:hypothetical protein n=1 Tax=uncultured Desulfovibrio sp. TaxID=167968 RepID=UPI0026DD70BC